MSGIEFIEIPIFNHFDTSKPPIGILKIRKDMVPSTPEWCLSLGYAALEHEDEKITKYEIKEMSIVSDSNYYEYLNRFLSPGYPELDIEAPELQYVPDERGLF